MEEKIKKTADRHGWHQDYSQSTQEIFKFNF